MTTQSLPISRTRNDYIYSTIVGLILVGSAVLLVFLTKPNALIMRQPRMTVVIGIAAIMFVTAYVFISRSPLSFFSRPLSWASVIISAIAMGALWFFNSDGSDGAWFRFTVLCLVITGGSTMLAEVMIFYRSFIKDKPWRFNIFHKLGFALVITATTFAIGYFYYEQGVSGGVIISYGNFNIPVAPDFSPDLPEGFDPTGGMGNPDVPPIGDPSIPDPNATPNPDTPASLEEPDMVDEGIIP